MVGWEVCCGVGWKEEEVTDRRVQECKWLSAKPADKIDQKPTRTRNFRNGQNPEIRNMQPEREILKNGENPEICKIQELKTKMNKTRITQKPVKSEKNKKKVQKTIREQNCSSKSLARTSKEAHDSCPFKMVSMKARKTQAKAEQTIPGCVEGV